MLPYIKKFLAEGWTWRIEEYPTNAVTVVDGGKRYVCQMMGYHDVDKGRSYALAELICKSPSMYRTLEEIRFEATGFLEQYEKVGATWTSRSGNEYEDTSYVLDKMTTIRDLIDEVLSHG